MRTRGDEWMTLLPQGRAGQGSEAGPGERYSMKEGSQVW